jgi:hypothetical protein
MTVSLFVANGQGLLLCWTSVFHQPEPLLNKVTKDDDKNCSLALFVGWN